MYDRTVAQHRPSCLDCDVPFNNLILRSLPALDLKQLLPFLEHVPLQRRHTIHLQNVEMEHVYFVESGLVSVIANIDRRKSAEVWLIGNEGVAGIPVILGEFTSPYRRVVQVEGMAYRMPAQKLYEAAKEIESLNDVLLYYAYTVLTQSARLAACNAIHGIRQRLARWLLMAQDRCERKTLPLSHDMLGRLLGVRRASVTDCFRTLEKDCVAPAGRSELRVMDRDKLQTAACSCYNLIRASDERLKRHCASPEQKAYARRLVLPPINFSAAQPI